MDSLERVDQPDYEGLLDLFPQNYHDAILHRTFVRSDRWQKMRHREEVVRYETMDQRPVLGHELDILSENPLYPRVYAQ